jgi:hypothetical protein
MATSITRNGRTNVDRLGTFSKITLKMGMHGRGGGSK